ncbi:MAG: TlpA family protein disulfide reductase [Chlorobi bacterium]|nr:TlpA family protein disulfide reductase [Chlorobiota bacterium]
MKNSTWLLFIIVVLSGCNKTTPDFTVELVKSIKASESIHFKAVERAYYSNEPDTTVTPYEVWAVRTKSDSVKGGYVWVDNNYRPYNMIYENGNFYLAIPPKKMSILYPDFNEPFINETDWIDFFLKPDLFENLLKNRNVVLKDTVYNEHKSIYINIELPEKNKILKKYSFIIDKKTYNPLWSKYTQKTKDFTYYDELEFYDFEQNNVDLSSLKQRQEQVLKENPVELNGANSRASRLEKMLHPGDNAPLFKAKYYAGGKSFELNDFIGKNVIIVDFWYTHCHPCVKAMPSLDDLFRKYRNKGLKVFGINSVDNQPRSKKLLDNFLAKRDISYDIILASPEVDIMYKVNGYPTMYVVDKDGKIAYAEIGFEEESFNTLREKVEELLKK